MQKLLEKMVELNASDIHIMVDAPIKFRVNERLISVDQEFLTPDVSKRLAYSMLSPDMIKKFEIEKELDFSFEVSDLSRFRVNIFYQRSHVSTAIRLIPFKIMTFEECGLPVNVVTQLCRKPKGLILVTGATGSGKTTTLASIIDKINTERDAHIITIEDPIEYVHENKKSIIEQREVGEDTHSFAIALRHVLREDPNVILIGEMRDLETVEAALNIAETGHLVLSTLHTPDTVQSINRIIDIFPPHQQPQVRTQLSFVVLAVLGQQLIPRIDKSGRVLAAEVLIATPAVRNLIREQKIHQLYSVIQTSQKDGMKTMNQSLYELCMNKSITYEEAITRTTDPADFERLFKK